VFLALVVARHKEADALWVKMPLALKLCVDPNEMPRCPTPAARTTVVALAAAP
jgi:hypothetical protein